MNEWARSSQGSSEFANAVSSEVADLFDYMHQDGINADVAVDLIMELVTRSLDGKTASKFKPEEVTPSSPVHLVNRQR